MKWRDLPIKFLPYRDYKGHWVWTPLHTQVRTIVKDGKLCREYREREETLEDWMERQW